MLTLFGGSPFELSGRASFSMLLFRIVMGSAFVMHGLPKIQHAMTWMTDAGMGELPGIIQAMAAVSEFGGGIALILGLLTPLAALGIMGTMVGAMAMVHIPMGHPFVAVGAPSFEMALLYMISSLMIFSAGPGQYSIDAVMQKNAGYPEASMSAS